MFVYGTTGTWGVGSSPNTLSGEADLLHVNMGFTIYLPPNIDAGFINTPTVNFSLMAYRLDNTMFQLRSNYNIGSITPGVAQYISGTVATFGPSTNGSFANWKDEAVRLVLVIEVAYPSATNPNFFGSVLGSKTIFAKVQ